MTTPRNKVGPYEFRYSRSAQKQGEKVGMRPTKCDVPGCPKPGPWAGTILGWTSGTYCTAHKDETLAVARGILRPAVGMEAVAA